MDLLAGVRKEGSRGGRGDFSWADVKEDQHRENYLGHSLMAPVGRWSKNRDLGWYAKGDAAAPGSTSAATARAAEIRAIKEAENDALAAALGLPAAPRGAATGANATDVKGALADVVEEEQGAGEAGRRGVGFGVFAGTKGGEDAEEMPGFGGQKERRRSRERSREMERRRRHRHHHHHHHHSRSPQPRYETSEPRSRSRSPSRSRSVDARRPSHRSRGEREPGRARDRARAHRRSRSRSRSAERPRRHSRERDGERHGDRGSERNRRDEGRSRRSPERTREHGGRRRAYERRYEEDRRR